MNILFNLFYFIVVTAIYLLALPFLVVLSFKNKYRQSLPARFFLYRNQPLEANGIWFHSCSFGEAKALKPLLEKFNPQDIRLTTTTQTGFLEINKTTTQSRYLPFELFLPLWIKPQKALVVMEAEYWYFLFAFAKLRGAKVIVINARMSDRSYKRYLRFAWFYRRIFALCDEVFAQTQIDKERLEALGADNITITGNIKLYQIAKPTKAFNKPNGLIICAASTHEKEEELILEAFKTLKAKKHEAKLLLVPRHPERFHYVVKLSQTFAVQNHLSFAQYSLDSTLQSDIIVVDTLGQLIILYAISDIVIAAGSFEPIGGHNVAEAAQFGCKIISGKEYFNQIDMYRSISGIRVVENHELKEALLNYQALQPTKILQQTNIEPIIESINQTL
ncbi:MAG: lipid IV(A) 3-deoxy-D-manno-octulosonic acid transferase [Campylobacterales bacterium]|nr:lipid IV(A) 3-deoxy-D-manno-octulosonic acid transferase [Campylobacterales bacterium]